MTNRFVHVPVVDIIKTFNKTFDLTEIEQRYILTHCQPADYPRIVARISQSIFWDLPTELSHENILPLFRAIVSFNSYNFDLTKFAITTLDALTPTECLTMFDYVVNELKLATNEFTTMCAERCAFRLLPALLEKFPVQNTPYSLSRLDFIGHVLTIAPVVQLLELMTTLNTMIPDAEKYCKFIFKRVPHKDILAVLMLFKNRLYIYTDEFRKRIPITKMPAREQVTIERFYMDQPSNRLVGVKDYSNIPVRGINYREQQYILQNCPQEQLMQLSNDLARLSLDNWRVIMERIDEQYYEQLIRSGRLTQIMLVSLVDAVPMTKILPFYKAVHAAQMFTDWDSITVLAIVQYFAIHEDLTLVDYVLNRARLFSPAILAAIFSCLPAVIQLRKFIYDDHIGDPLAEYIATQVMVTEDFIQRVVLVTPRDAQGIARRILAIAQELTMTVDALTIRGVKIPTDASIVEAVQQLGKPTKEEWKSICINNPSLILLLYIHFSDILDKRVIAFMLAHAARDDVEELYSRIRKPTNEYRDIARWRTGLTQPQLDEYGFNKAATFINHRGQPLQQYRGAIPSTIRCDGSLSLREIDPAALSTDVFIIIIDSQVRCLTYTDLVYLFADTDAWKYKAIHRKRTGATTIAKIINSDDKPEWFHPDTGTNPPVMPLLTLHVPVAQVFAMLSDTARLFYISTREARKVPALYPGIHHTPRHDKNREADASTTVYSIYRVDLPVEKRANQS